MFFLKSLVYSVFSPSFYCTAIRRSGKRATGNFVLFIALASLVSSLYFIVTFGAYVRSVTTNNDLRIPTITIENGVLTTDPNEPMQFIVPDNTVYLAIDATGTISEIPSTYSSGILLTQTAIIFRSDESYTADSMYRKDQSISYNELLTQLELHSISFDHDTFINIIGTMSTVIIVLSPVAIFFGLLLSKMIAVLIIGLLGMIVFNVAGTPTSLFRSSVIIALYAVIPVMYVELGAWLINKTMMHIGISFTPSDVCCFFSILGSLIKWGLFWGIGAFGVIRCTSETSAT